MNHYRMQENTQVKTYCWQKLAILMINYIKTCLSKLYQVGSWVTINKQ